MRQALSANRGPYQMQSTTSTKNQHEKTVSSALADGEMHFSCFQNFRGPCFSCVAHVSAHVPEPLAHMQPAIDREISSGDKACRVIAQKRYRAADIIRRTHVADRDLRDDLLAHLFGYRQRHLGADVAR